jgi:glycyl-tRNA synthetase beta subunit
MPRRKINPLSQFQAVDEDENVVILPKEQVENKTEAPKPLPVVKAKDLGDFIKPAPKEKKPPTEAQLKARQKLAEFNAARRAAINEKKQADADEVKAKLKAEQQALLDAGTHVKVVVKKHGNTGKKKIQKSGSRVKKVVEEPRGTDRREEPSETSDTSDTDITETDTDTDMDDYKSKARKTRVQAKKVVRTIQKIDKVLQQAPPAPQNPYTAMLASRWR